MYYDVLLSLFLFISVSPHLDAIKAAMSSRGDQLTPREHAYIRAVLAYASGSLSKANDEFINMLVDYPLGKFTTSLLIRSGSLEMKLGNHRSHNNYNIPPIDAIALRIALISLSFLGHFERMRDMFASSLIHWSEDMQLYPYVLGL